MRFGRRLHAREVHDVAPGYDVLKAPRAPQRFELARPRNAVTPRASLLPRGRGVATGVSDCSATKVPRPTADLTNPAFSRLVYARTTVLRFVVSSLASSRVGGKAKTGRESARKNAANDLVEQLLVERIPVRFVEDDAHASAPSRHLDWINPTGPISTEKAQDCDFQIDQIVQFGNYDSPNGPGSGCSRREPEGRPTVTGLYTQTTPRLPCRPAR